MKKNSKLAVAGGIMLLPILFAIFLSDRILGSILFWMPLPSAREYFDTMNHFITSLYRIGAVLTGFGIYYFVQWIF
jgi:hypothetical protein